MYCFIDLHSEILDGVSIGNSGTQRYVANLQSIFVFPEERLQISQDHDMLDGSDWEYRTANTSHVTDDRFESFHAKVKQKWDRHVNEHEGKFTVDQVGTYSVSSKHEHNREDNQRKKMKSNEELIELLHTDYSQNKDELAVTAEVSPLQRLLVLHLNLLPPVQHQLL